MNVVGGAVKWVDNPLAIQPWRRVPLFGQDGMIRIGFMNDLDNFLFCNNVYLCYKIPCTFSIITKLIKAVRLVHNGLSRTAGCLNCDVQKWMHVDESLLS